MDLTVHDAYTCNLVCPLLDMNPTAGTVLLSFKIANWLWWKHPCSTITDPPYRRRDSGMLLQIAIQLQYTLLLPRPKKKKKQRERICISAFEFSFSFFFVNNLAGKIGQTTSQIHCLKDCHGKVPVLHYPKLLALFCLSTYTIICFRMQLHLMPPLSQTIMPTGDWIISRFFKKEVRKCNF